MRRRTIVHTKTRVSIRQMRQRHVETEAVPPRAGLMMFLLEAALDQALAERPLRESVFAGFVAPLLVRLVEIAAPDRGGCLPYAPLLDEPSQHVHLLAVALGRLADSGRGPKAIPLPGKAPIDSPAEDAG